MTKVDLLCLKALTVRERRRRPNLARISQSRGHDVHLTRQPSTGIIGKQVRAFLAKQEGTSVNWEMLALLFAADRLHHWQTEIEPALNDGKTVISDRYVLSSLVYQGDDCPEEWVREINRFAPKPDLTLFVRVSGEVAFERVRARGGVVEVYDELAKQKPLRRGTTDWLPRKLLWSWIGSNPSNELLRCCVSCSKS